MQGFWVETGDLIEALAEQSDLGKKGRITAFVATVEEARGLGGEFAKTLGVPESRALFPEVLFFTSSKARTLDLIHLEPKGLAFSVELPGLLAEVTQGRVCCLRLCEENAGPFQAEIGWKGPPILEFVIFRIL